MLLNVVTEKKVTCIKYSKSLHVILLNAINVIK